MMTYRNRANAEGDTMTDRADLLCRCVAIRTAMRQDDGSSVAASAWRLHLRVVQWQLARLREGSPPLRSALNER